MTKEEIEHLGSLARIRLTDKEVESFAKEISAIVDYVGAISAIVEKDQGGREPVLGQPFNVFRSDVVTNEADVYTEDLLKEAPHRKGRYFAVKKILQQDE